MLNKKCENHCPDCGATDPDIEWGDKEWFDDGAYQTATCKKCNCEFKEYYKYSETEYEIEMTRKRWGEMTNEDRIIWLSECGMTEKEADEIVCNNPDDLPDEIKSYFEDIE